MRVSAMIFFRVVTRSAIEQAGFGRSDGGDGQRIHSAERRNLREQSLAAQRRSPYEYPAMP